MTKQVAKEGVGFLFGVVVELEQCERGGLLTPLGPNHAFPAPSGDAANPTGRGKPDVSERTVQHQKEICDIPAAHGPCADCSKSISPHDK